MRFFPGHFLICSDSGIKDVEYWSLKSYVHEDNFNKTVEKTRFLIEDAITMQMKSDVPICTFLSGGIDSSLVSGICAKKLQEKREKLNTFSFDFVDNDKYFKANNFPAISRSTLC